MRIIINKLITAFYVVGLIGVGGLIGFIFALLIWLFTFLFDKRLVILHWYSCIWASTYTVLMPAWRLKIEGRDKIRKKATYVVISNHQSQLDIPAIFRLHFHFKWVSKAEVFKLPFFGWNMRLNRYIKLVRGDKESVARMMIDCERTLSGGSSVLFFPEGTRSDDGHVKKFKPGAFVLAEKLKLPILPICIWGTINALPKYSIDYHGIQRIHIKVIDEIPYEKYAGRSIEEICEMARKAVSDEVERMREQMEKSQKN